jgi:transposase
LYNLDWSPQRIAEALLISDQAVRNHIEEYKAAKKLHIESGGSEEKLTSKQSERLETHLNDHTYLYAKDIIAYVQVTFRVSYTVPDMTSWLQRHGFSYKKPAVVPGKADKKQQ